MPQDTDRPGPSIKCSCGFEVTSTDEFYNQVAFGDHPCPNQPPRRWHESVFSMWGAAILIALIIFAAAAVVDVTT